MTKICVGGSRFEDKKNSTELSFLFVSIDILFLFARCIPVCLFVGQGGRYVLTGKANRKLFGDLIVWSRKQLMKISK